MAARVGLAIVVFIVTVSAFTAHCRELPEDGRDMHYHPRHSSGSPSSGSASQFSSSASQKAPVDWIQRGKDELSAALNLEPRWKPAKNVILFIGDGMGVSTHTPARIYKAQKAGQPIPDAKLSWEDMPYSGLTKTYNTDYQTPDSAGTATAFLSGEKSRYGVIGVNQNVPRGDCNMTEGNEVKSMIHHAMDEGKWTGVVTTARITHATPSAAYANCPDRDWENDADVTMDGWDPEQCWDIGRQLVYNGPNKNIRVLLGGGRREMMSNDTADPEYPDETGQRQDGRDLRQEWLDVHSNMAIPTDSYTYVEDKADFDAVDPSKVDYLLGLFEPSHMKYEADRREETNDTWGEPSLAEMVKKSLNILKRGNNGYFLLAEGGRIDHAHHDTNAYRALEDTLALEEAVQVAMDETSAEDTLIIVTADHSHVFSMGGYQLLDTDILGLVSDEAGLSMADDDKPYLTLGYGNGPGWYNHRDMNGTETSRLNLTGVDTTDKDFLQDTPVPIYSETHGGEDVAVYARGPMAHLFVGLHEQSYIAHATMYAACVGWNKNLCENPPLVPGCEPPAGGVDSSVHRGYFQCIILTFGVIFKWILF